MDTKNLSDLSPTTLAAIAKMATDAAKKSRSELSPGVHQVADTVVFVLQGTVSVSEDTEKSPTCSIPLLPALALLAKRMGATRDAALEMLREVMSEALEMKEDAAKALLAETGVAEMEQRIKREVLSKLPKTPVAGAVKVAATISLA